MKAGVVLGFFAAIVFHAGFLLFGGLLFHRGQTDHGTLQKVELVSETAMAEEKAKEKKEPAPAKEREEQTVEAEAPPDAQEVIQSIEVSAAASATALEAASLSAIEAALNPGGASGGGAFAEALSFASGGKIGGLAKAGAGLDEGLENAFSLGELDQRPRAIFQAAPSYPAELRARKVEGVVQIVFVVDAGGRVVGPRIEKSTDPAFDKPAVDAVKQWKFEPAIKGGQRVPCKMRAPIRFQPS